MKGVDEERIKRTAVYILEHQSTVRATAAHFGISKSTVHKDVTERLRYMDAALFRQVREVLDTNKAERHLRGGIATKNKYQQVARDNNPLQKP